MIKYSFKLATILFLFLSTVAHAGLITDLTENNYITIDELDWAWASTVNVEFHTKSGNTLSGPGDNFGWRYATTSELDAFKFAHEAAKELLTLRDDDEEITGYKHALSFWNDKIDELELVTPFFFTMTNDIDDFNNGLINSTVGVNEAEFDYLTFYVRNTPAQVPEPSTLMIFAIALIALSMKKRAIK
ncbi:MAG: PEP-CTERM sorting domain-containing protein [Alteromonadaceae bacterium]|jgi:hypothetical protein